MNDSELRELARTLKLRMTRKGEYMLQELYAAINELIERACDLAEQLQSIQRTVQVQTKRVDKLERHVKKLVR